MIGAVLRQQLRLLRLLRLLLLLQRLPLVLFFHGYRRPPSWVAGGHSARGV